MKTKSSSNFMKRSLLLRIAMLLTVAAMSRSSRAQLNSNEFLPFQKFVASTAAASPDEYMSRPGSQVKDAAAFDEMRRYILTIYQGVQVEHSMVEDSGYFDCVPVAQQPTARLLGINEIDQPPVELPPGSGDNQRVSAVDIQPAFDSFGNSLSCEAGTIPMRRLSLDEMTQFVTLSDFLRRGRGLIPTEGDVLPPAAREKRYAVERQHVDNLGTVSEISLWDPPVADVNEFSLAQQWVSGDSGAALQTIEGGWIKSPGFFRMRTSVLFIFWTSRNYMDGCYNLECAGFMQTDVSWTLGGTFPRYSVSGGEQHWFSMEWYFVSNGRGSKNWWLLLKHDNDDWKWVGYYPERIFNGGQLTKNADELDFGGETDPGGDVWPFMGSGAYPDQGWTKAAYQSNVKYTDLNRNVRAATLRVQRESENCYKVGTPAVQNARVWGTYFFFGGPGGRNCQ
jgi:Neprosin